MRGVFARITFVLVVCLGILSNPVLADFKSFGVYQDTDPNGRLDPGDTFLGGVMNWLTMYSAASSYNYGDHDDSKLIGRYDLTGAPYGVDHTDMLLPEDKRVFSWLPMEDHELHFYMVWSDYDNEEEGSELSGFSLGMIANDYVIGRTDHDPSGTIHLDIAVRNDGTSVPQVTMSDDYLTQDPDPLERGRPPSPGYKQDSSQELYKTTVDETPGVLYNHYFEGIWQYTATTGDGSTDGSTADGGVIGGIHNGDYDIIIDPDKMVTSVTGDGLVIRIDPEALGEITKIVIWDFGYLAGAADTPGVIPPTYYDESGWGTYVEIPLGTETNKTFFIASIPVPEPSTLLSLLIAGGMIGLTRRRGRSRM